MNKVNQHKQWKACLNSATNISSTAMQQLRNQYSRNQYQHSHIFDLSSLQAPRDIYIIKQWAVTQLKSSFTVLPHIKRNNWYVDDASCNQNKIWTLANRNWRSNFQHFTAIEFHSWWKVAKQLTSVNRQYKREGLFLQDHWIDPASHDMKKTVADLASRACNKIKP